MLIQVDIMRFILITNHLLVYKMIDDGRWDSIWGGGTLLFGERALFREGITSPRVSENLPSLSNTEDYSKV